MLRFEALLLKFEKILNLIKKISLNNQVSHFVANHIKKLTLTLIINNTFNVQSLSLIDIIYTK